METDTLKYFGAETREKDEFFAQFQNFKDFKDLPEAIYILRGMFLRHDKYMKTIATLATWSCRKKDEFWEGESDGVGESTLQYSCNSSSAPSSPLSYFGYDTSGSTPPSSVLGDQDDMKI
jgi:hypothetical protein